MNNMENMDSAFNRLVEREEENKVRAYEKMSVYERALERAVQKIDHDGKQEIIYTNNSMMEKNEQELMSQVALMKEMEKKLRNQCVVVSRMLEKHHVDKIQEDIERLNQRIRILEATVEYINEGKS